MMGTSRTSWFDPKPVDGGPQMTNARGVALLVAVALLVGCGDAELVAPETPGPLVVIPAGISTSHTAAEMAQRMLDEIAANERKLGRSLAPPRIVKIQLLRAGEMFPLRHFDGTNPGGSAMSPNDGPGWMVEAVGTFVGDDRTGQIDSIGMHGFHLWGDAGGEGFGFIACRTRVPAAPSELEGSC
jgi:hypothetical protein